MRFIRIYADIRISAYTMRIFLCGFMRYAQKTQPHMNAHMKNNHITSSSQNPCLCQLPLCLSMSFPLSLTTFPSLSLYIHCLGQNWFYRLIILRCNDFLTSWLDSFVPSWCWRILWSKLTTSLWLRGKDLLRGKLKPRSKSSSWSPLIPNPSHPHSHFSCFFCLFNFLILLYHFRGYKNIFLTSS